MTPSHHKGNVSLALATAATVSGAGKRAGRPSTHRRYRTSDGQTLIGYSSIILGALSLVAVLLGYLRGSEIVPMFIVCAIALGIAMAWCAWERKFQNATVYGVFAAFNLSYALLQLGVSNNWYSIPIVDLTNVLSFYAIAWVAILLLLSFVAFNASIGAFGVFISAIASLVLVAVANTIGSLSLLRWAAAPLGAVILISTLQISQVMLGWHRRNRIEAARVAAGQVPSGDESTVLPILDRRRQSEPLPSE